MRDRSTRLAVSVRDRAIAISFAMSSSPMVNSTTSRAAAILKASFSESPNKATMHRRKIESRSTQRFHGIAALGRGLIQIHAIIMAARATAGEVVLRVAVVPGCDASPVLQLAEHPFVRFLRL